MIGNEQINMLQTEKLGAAIDKERIEALVNEKFETIKAPSGLGVYASAGENYQYAIFGRDSIEVGEDLLFVNPVLVKEIILAMAGMQGIEKNDKTEEEFGKIHHEYRAMQMGGVLVPEKSKKIIETLSSRWGGSDGILRYYGSIDSTPLFVRLVGRYVDQHGPEILNTEVVGVKGDIKPLVNHVFDAAEWVKTKVESSPWGLLEFKRENPNGLAYQSWKDSRTGYLHLDGVPAAADKGIASIEVQGYAYDALMAASRLKILSDDENNKYIELAQNLQKNTIKLLWVDDKEEPFFAIGIDRDNNGTTRQIQTRTSNNAALLDSNLLLDLPQDERVKYVVPIVNMIMGSDFITSVGVRCRSLRHNNLIDYADYHGCLVSWPKETYDITKGFRRHGFTEQADDLENRLLVAVQKSNEFYEFYYVDSFGDVKYNYARGGENDTHIDNELSIPESCQAWTMSAIKSILHPKTKS